MIIALETFEQMINSPIRSTRGRVEIYEGSTLSLICGCHDRLKDFKVERIGEKNKIFGYGICQKLTVNLLDKNRELNITKSNYLEVEFGVENNYIYPFPSFYVDEVKRDENTNDLTITAYDAIYAAGAHTVSELDLPVSYTIGQFVDACAAVLGIPVKKPLNASFNTFYENGANFEGTETIREALNAVAEATQTIYYIDNDWNLVFKRLDINGQPVTTIDKTKYFTLDTKESVEIATLVSATELGDDVIISNGKEGATQYIRNNPFWELREDIDVLLNNAMAAVDGLKLNQFTCSWRGNYLLEIGDKIAITTKDDNTITSFILDDTIEFTGALSGSTAWTYEQEDRETSRNPVALGEALKYTFAKVDKQAKTIELVASEAQANREEIASIRTTTSDITASVSNIETQISEANDAISTLSKQVEAQITEEDIKIQIKSELANGVDKVVTGKGFTLDDEGFTVSDLNPETNNQITTTISNNGMVVKTNSSEKLKANDEGVKAEDLHATTYLIIGNNSRFEDYGSDRTGCFWIGG